MRIRYEYGGEAIEVRCWRKALCRQEFQRLLSKLAPWKDMKPPRRRELEPVQLWREDGSIEDFPTIQSAIAAASSADTIRMVGS